MAEKKRKRRQKTIRKWRNNLRRYWVEITGLTVVIGVVAVVWIWKAPDRAGEVGDLIGGVAGAVALLFLVRGLMIQGRQLEAQTAQLKAQRKDLRLTRKELRQTREEHEALRKSHERAEMRSRALVQPQFNLTQSKENAGNNARTLEIRCAHQFAGELAVDVPSAAACEAMELTDRVSSEPRLAVSPNTSTHRQGDPVDDRSIIFGDVPGGVTISFVIEEIDTKLGAVPLIFGYNDRLGERQVQVHILSYTMGIADMVRDFVAEGLLQERLSNLRGTGPSS